MTKIRQAHTEDAPAIRELAEAIWWPTYTSIISREQIRYMLDHIYDIATISRQIEEGSQTYLLLYEEDQPVGFAAYSPRPENPEVYKLHKIYCLTSTRGKGFGRILMAEVERRVSAAGKDTLELNVNKYNPAKGFYEHLGYEVAYEEDIPIGDFWMNDYVMRKRL